MIQTTTWLDPLYKEAVYLTFILLGVVGIGLYPFRNKDHHFKTAWMSWRSWLIAFPIMVLLLALEDFWPLVGFACISIIAMKEFFKMTGIYNNYLFVWINYIFVWISAYTIYTGDIGVYNVLPMILLFSLSIVPILKNEYKDMLKSISLCLIAYLMICWSFMHLAWIEQWEQGARHVLYILLLTEICDNINLAYSRWFGRTNWFKKIAPRRSTEGFVVSIIFTLGIAFGLRHLLPDQSEIYWISAGIIAAMVGGMGDIVLSGIRRDVNVKDRGTFILGRDGVIDRIDRLIFVAPFYYYSLKLLEFYV